MKKNFLVVALVTFIANSAQADLGDLLISEIAVTPFGSEFIEIHNSGDSSIDLSDVYLTDATFDGGPTYYYQIVIGGGGGGGFFDFHSRFPDGASIAAGDYQTISLNGSTEFSSAFGVTPTYELFEDGGSADGIPDMREAFPGSINDQGGLTDGGEVVILYTWDGISDLVEDLDYVVWGDKEEAVSKTGVSIDSSTDGDATPSSYAADTAIVSQIVISATAHGTNESWQRSDLSEGNEDQSGGNNGFQNQDDETSEDTNNTFTAASPTPNLETGGILPPGAPSILINEVDAVGTAEFIEIYDGGAGNTSLANVKVVLFDGSNDLAYAVYDLSAFSTDNSGYFLLGNDTTPAPEVVLPANTLQDGADAVVVYFDSAIAVSDPVNTSDVIDAFVYDSDDADDAGLLVLLNPNQDQINENSNSQASTQSSARCINGSGGALNTSTYLQVVPTPGSANNVCPDGYYASVTPNIIENPAMIRSTLHNIIDDHTVHSYSFACTMLSFADEDPSNSNNVWMVYSNESMTWQGNCSGPYNREHTWPRSHFHGDESTPTNSDIHHLMLSNKDYNSLRGNLIFDNCTANNCDNTGLTTVAHNGIGGGNAHGDSNWENGSVFEVWDARKGDIARAMFYVDVRYSGDVSGEYDLQLIDDPAFYNTAPYMGKLSTMCEWHKLDPVDDIERERNEVVYSYQDNRNPFIDHPEWVSKVFAATPACQENDLIFESGFEQAPNR